MDKNALANELLQLGNSIGFKAVQRKYFAMGSEDFNPMKNTTLVEDCQCAAIGAMWEEIITTDLINTMDNVVSDDMRKEMWYDLIRIGYRACNKYTDGLRRDIKKHMWIETRDKDGEIIAEQFEDVTSDIQKMTIDREDIQNGLKELSPLETRVLKYMALGYLDETITRRIYREDTPKTRHKVATIKHKIRAKMSQYINDEFEMSRERERAIKKAKEREEKEQRLEERMKERREENEKMKRRERLAKINKVQREIITSEDVEELAERFNITSNF